MKSLCVRVLAVAGVVVLSTALTARAADQAAEQPAASPAPATQPSAPSEPKQPAAATQPDPLDVVVCKKEETTVGSRLGARKVCKTRRQWRDEQRDATSPDLPDGSAQPPTPSTGP